MRYRMYHGKMYDPSKDTAKDRHIFMHSTQMKICSYHIHATKGPLEYDICFDEMLDLWAFHQVNLIAWSSK